MYRRVFLTWAIALLTISILLKTHQCALTTDFPKGRKALRAGSATPDLHTSCYHTSVAISLPSSLCPVPFTTTPHSPQFPNNNISVSASSLDFPHLMQPRPHLQLSWGHFGSQLDDTANSHACSPGRVQLIPNGVTVHLSKQSAEPTEGAREREKEKEWMKEEGRGRGGVKGKERESKFVRKGWHSNSLCTITLVFRLGQLKRPSGHSFAYIFSLHWLLQWKHIPAMPHCHSLFRFLITNSIT